MLRNKKLISVALAVMVWSGSLAWPAFAHASLVSANPAVGSVLTEFPSEVTLTFDDNLTVIDGQAVNEIQVVGPAQTRVDDGVNTVDQASLSVGLTTRVNGVYSVTYRVLSADGHPVSGEYQFKVITQPQSTRSTSTPRASTAQGKPSKHQPSTKHEAETNPKAFPTANASPSRTATSSTGLSAGVSAPSTTTASPSKAAQSGVSWLWLLGAAVALGFLGLGLRSRISSRR